MNHEDDFIRNTSHGMIRTATVDTVTGRGTRRFLVGILAIIALASAPLPALANGGTGGQGEATNAYGGSGGTTNITTAGGAGSVGTLGGAGTTGGSGGGGAGITGGAGGASLQDNSQTNLNGAPASGGATPGASGANGVDGSDSTRTTGGGGGGGAHGAVLTTTTTNAGTTTGGNGGKGGYGGYSQGGGGGGAGGYGVVMNGSGLSYTNTNTGTVAGGAGGAGGSASIHGGSGDGGAGGDGGIGMYFTGSGTLNNASSITGGAGGAGGAGATSIGKGGAGGAGGTGVHFTGSGTLNNSGSITGGAGGGSGASGGGGADAAGTGGVGVIVTGSSTITDSGTIAGGVSGSGAQADAVDFSGGGNTLELLPGYTLTGNVLSTSGTSGGGDTLELGGSSNATLSGYFESVAPTSYTTNPVFYGFQTLKKTGTGTWTITTGLGTNVIPHWDVEDGVLQVTYNYTPSATDSLIVGGGQLVVSGKANLAGTLDVNVASGHLTVGTRYDLIHAGTAVSGTFGTVSESPGFANYLTPTVRYGTNDVFLTLNPRTAAFTSAQGTAGNGWVTVNGLLGGQQALLNAQGGTAGNIPTVNGQPDPGVWFRAVRGYGGAYGASVGEGTELIGGGDEVRPGLILGGALGTTRTRTDTSNESVSTRSFGVYGYGLYDQGPLFVDGTAAAGRLHTDSHRSLPPTGLAAVGSAPGWYAGFSEKAGWRMHEGMAFLTPYAGLAYIHIHRNAYGETGAGSLDLSYGSATTDLASLRLGARLGMDWHPDRGTTVTPWLGLGGIAYVGNRHRNLPVTLGTVQQTLAATVAPATAATLGAGVEAVATAHWSAELAYNGQFSGGTHMNTGDFKVVYRW